MKNMIMILLALGMSTKNLAQNSSPDKRRAEKIAFITTKLELTSEEAEKFWPIYNEAEVEHKELRKTHKNARPTTKISEMTDAEVEKLLDEGLDFQQKSLDLKKKYNAKFKEVIPIKKVAKLIHLEHEYRQTHKKKTAK